MDCIVNTSVHNVRKNAFQCLVLQVKKDGLNLMSIDLDISTHPLASPKLRENILNAKSREKTLILE